MTMIYAFVTMTPDLVQHSRANRGTFEMIIPQNKNETIVQPAVEERSAEGSDFYLIHGWIMWAAWALLGAL